MVKPRALIIGGSLGGLFAANLLRSAGWDVSVFERAQTDLSGRGAGLGTRAELFDILRRLGIACDTSIGTDVRSRIALDRLGRVVCELPMRSRTTAWDRVYSALKASLPEGCYHAGRPLLAFEQHGGKVQATFVDCTRIEGDLLIAADGIRSTVRGNLMPEIKPRYAGYVAWRGVGSEDDPSLHQQLFDHMTFGFSQDGLLLSIPMPGRDEAATSMRRCQFSWFRPADVATLRDLCTDDEGRFHPASMPPHLIRTNFVDQLKQQAIAELAPQLAALVVRAERLILQPVFDLETPRIVFDRVALLGDAAFVARPHVGTGVTKAALDAQCLTDLLGTCGDIDVALARYDRDRRIYGRQLVARGRYLGRHLEARNVSESDDPAHRHPETIMREFGSAGVISALD